MAITAAQIAEIWNVTVRDTPSTYHEMSPWMEKVFDLPRTSYRERLDKQRLNARGVLIPHIAIVRNNIRRFRAKSHFGGPLTPLEEMQARTRQPRKLGRRRGDPAE